MKYSKGKSTYLQCTNCGNIYKVDQAFSTESLYIDSLCKCCGNKKALNLGEDENDIYIYYDVTKDERYY